MNGCQKYGIIRKNGFLYLDKGAEIQFRIPGDIKRDIKEIAPEEQAAGMLEILKQNVSADRNGLYHSLAVLCGISRVGRAVNDAMDKALQSLKEFVVIEGEQVSLK